MIALRCGPWANITSDPNVQAPASVVRMPGGSRHKGAEIPEASPLICSGRLHSGRISKPAIGLIANAAVRLGKQTVFVRRGSAPD